MSFEIERRNSSTSSPKVSNHVTISNPAETENNKDHEPLMYGIDDKPPWYMCILLGFQVLFNLIVLVNSKPTWSLYSALFGNGRSHSCLSIYTHSYSLHVGR